MVGRTSKPCCDKLFDVISLCITVILFTLDYIYERKARHLPMITEIQRRTLALCFPHVSVQLYWSDNCLTDIENKIRLTELPRFIDQGRLPHLLLYGPPGTGKTSTILATAKALFSPREISSMVLELNASDARGISVVREQVLTFASTKTLFMGKFKLVILDEADSMTKDAQNALRRIIEKFTENTRFCLICNYISKVIPAIQSRCTKFRFAPVSFSQMAPRLKEIAVTESVNLSEEGIKAIYRFTSGDMRKAINLMQSAAMSATIIDETSVYACVAYPSPAEIRTLTDWMLNETIQTAYTNIFATKNLKGIALQDILTELHPMIMKIDLPDAVRCDLLIKIADIEHRMSTGSSERLQLGAVVAAFSKAKSNLAALRT